MSIRFSFGGDEHIFAEVSEEMSLEASFTSLSMTNAVKAAGNAWPGITKWTGREPGILSCTRIGPFLWVLGMSRSTLVNHSLGLTEYFSA